MRILIAAWVVVVGAVAGGSYWLSSVEVPEPRAAEAETKTVTGAPGVLTTGPIAVDIEKPVEEDCLGSEG